MNVGVLTFHWAENYGALLQAYGLCQTLEGLGHTVHLINYVPPAQRLRWWQGWRLRSGWPMPFHVLRRLRYERFRHGRLPLTRPCNTIEELRAVSGDLDAVIVGSDQVWNGNIVRTSDARYLLDFVDKGCRRISYAACFGEHRQPQRTLEAAASLLPRFDHVSVRNEMSADLVRQLAGKEASVVADPSLLHDYKKILKPQTGRQPYIAAYAVCPHHVAAGQRVWRRTKQRLNLPVLAIGPDLVPAPGERVILSAGPSEWVSFLHGASFICTDSFHGTIFAIKYRKPFITWASTRTERLTSLLHTCGIDYRLADSDDPPTLDHIVEAPIDYDAVHCRLLPHINRSRNFLESALAPIF